MSVSVDHLPYPLSSPGFRRLLGDVVLPLWFVLLGFGNLVILGPNAIGVDAKIYYRGSQDWLVGADPWNASAGFDGNIYHYAGFPSTTVLFAPFTVLPEWLFVGGWLLLGLVAAIWIVRLKLKLPWWWLAFPPLLEGLFSGNPSILLLALLLSGNSVLQAIAPPLKLYAGVPLGAQLRLRAILGAALLGALTIAVAPDLWLSFWRDLPAVTSRLLAESAGGFGANAWPVLLAVAIIAVVALAIVDRTAAGWLAVLAVWPASEFHYSTLALPVMTPWLGAILALPIRGLPAVAVVLYVVVRVWQWRRERSDVAVLEPEEPVPA